MKWIRLLGQQYVPKDLPLLLAVIHATGMTEMNEERDAPVACVIEPWSTRERNIVLRTVFYTLSH